MRGGKFSELRVQDIEDTGSQLIVTVLKTKTDYPRTFVIGPNTIVKFCSIKLYDLRTQIRIVTHTLTSTIQTAPNLQLTTHPMTEAPKIYSTPTTLSTILNTITSTSTTDTEV
ncbi:hypothetical protein KQX54_011505 [Cotesia glomerata]|uniref:Uncharacterized protein n=1 Tax=Cotesia glomerata TaxID=32391 RepID=A0AAV7J490_COTGL|nr:hypothetical protein KQX54_011505 [Cotesia glomerata]